MSEDDARQSEPPSPASEPRDEALPTHAEDRSVNRPAERRWRTILAPVAVAFVMGALFTGVLQCAGGESKNDAQHAHEDGTTAAYTCSMHPQIRQPEPGPCPICGMDLIPVTGDGDDGASPNRVVLSERAQTLMQLRTTAVRPRTQGAADLRLLGRVEPNETTLKTITAWTGGRIDRLRVKVTGERVRAGQVIADLYSPEVYAAHQDLLVAKKQVARLSGSAASAQSAASGALEAARERLRLLGVPNDELKRLEAAEAPTRSVPIRTPFGGTIIEREATEGAYVTTGAPLYKLADLSRLWIQLDAYENDLQRLSIDQAVRVKVEALPGEEFEGTVTFIDPTVDTRKRTARVRVAVKNEDGRLRPGMFAEAVTFSAPTGDADAQLVIPATAPLFTGRRAIVYVEVGHGDRLAYEPRTVRLGPRIGSYYPVVAGLLEGDRVVTRGAFALDADLQIRAGMSMMAAPDDREPGAFDEAIDVPKAELTKLAPVVRHYLTTQKALAADDLARAQTAAASLEAAAIDVTLERPAEAKHFVKTLGESLAGHARRIHQANNVELARSSFEGLSHDITHLLERLGNPLSEPLVQAHCPMAFGSRGAAWIQERGTIDNAYFGESMRTCGSVEQSVAPGAHLSSVPMKSGERHEHEGHAH